MNDNSQRSSPNVALAVARHQFLERHGLNDALLTRTLAEISVKGVDFADLYFQSRHREMWHLEEGIVKTASSAMQQGVGVRAVRGDQSAFSFTEDLSAPALARAASMTRTIARSGAAHSVDVGPSVFPPVSSPLYSSSNPLQSLDASTKVTLLERVEKLARSKDPRITQVTVDLTGEHDVVLIARSDGMFAADIRPLVRMSVNVIAEQRGRRESGRAGGGGRFDYRGFSDEILTRYVDDAVHTALTNLDARPAPAGAMTVVLGPGWPGVMLHEAIGHGLEGDFNRKGSSAFAGRIGERIAAKGVTVVDDGTLPNRRGSLNIDDEGNPTQCTMLIEDGILKGYMQDSLNARLMKTHVTGNARRESYAVLPMPRMTNTYMLDGDKDPGEILASVKNGVYAVNFGGGQVDITNGKFVFSASEAYMIENGRITYPVKGVTLIGSGPESLKCVTMIGNDMSLDSGVGVCGKEGQSVPVGVGQPTLRIDGLTVGGTA
ncbi:metalloprotease TldD [Caballeronia sp. dw_19]|uniref:metalloprotease TldD n=1 Tax=Caballeronia sp. dw_19 TaxID=2719791 RepID=UPI001BD5C799|nr:metalloprotease TldD [Caballeronia sp. dw_19]